MSGISYTVDVDKEHVADAVAAFEFVGGNSKSALRIAINKCSPKIKTAVSLAIRGQVNLRADYVKERLEITKATNSNLSGAIKTPSRGLLLSRFSADKVIANDLATWLRPPAVPAAGIKVKIKPKGGAKFAPGMDGNKPFYMRLNNGKNLGIAARMASGKIHVFSGPSLSQVFNTVRNDVLPEAGAELTAQLLDAMRYLLVKQYPPEPLT